MGRHIAVGRRRGVAGWPLVVLGLVVLVIAGTVVYFALLRKGNAATATNCTGTVSLPVLASSGASPVARALSDAFNATSPEARSTCLATSVTTLSAGDAGTALAVGWVGRSDPAPGVWITDDGSVLAAVDRSNSELTAGRDAEPIASSPVVLAMRKADAARHPAPAWSKMAVELTNGAGPHLVLPDPQTNRATAYALSSMMATTDSAPTVAAAKKASSRLKALSTFRSDAPTTGDALDQIAGSEAMDAVPVTEADLAVYNNSSAEQLTAVYPPGPTAGDDVFAVALSGGWMTPTLIDAATRFHAFARSPDGQKILVAAHLRVPGMATPAAAGIHPETAVSRLPPAEPGVAATLATGIGFTKSGATPPPAAAGSSVPPASSVLPAPSGSSAPTSTRPSATAPPAGSPRPAGSTAPTSSPTAPTTSRTAPTTNSTAPTTNSTTSNSSGTGSAVRPPVIEPGPAVTFLVDTSSTWETVVSGQSRTSWLQQGLTEVLAHAGSTEIGLWSTSSNDGIDGYRTLVPTGPLTEKLDGGFRSAELTSAIADLDSSGTRRNYRALPKALSEAAVGASSQHPHRVILVTDGPDQTPDYSRAAAIAEITAATQNNPNVHLEIIGVGEAAPDQSLQGIAAAGNGSYTDVARTPELPAALLSVFDGS